MKIGLLLFCFCKMGFKPVMLHSVGRFLARKTVPTKLCCCMVGKLPVPETGDNGQGKNSQSKSLHEIAPFEIKSICGTFE